MNNLILIAFCFFAGVVLHRLKKMPANTTAILNIFIIHVSFPALILLSVHELKFSGDIGLMAAAGWIYFALSAGFFWLLGRWLKLPRSTVGALILTGGLGNTAYVGMPMIETFYGFQGISSGIIVDQFGSFLVLSTLGITVAGIYSSGPPGAREMIKRIIKFPPFIALIVGLFLIPMEYSEWMTSVLKRISDTLVPLALFSIGFQMRLGHFVDHGRNLAIGLAFKLVLAPMVLFLLYVHIFGAHGQNIQITLFEEAMPPMITAAILAAEHDLDPQLATLMVTVGLIISFATLPIWWWFMRGV